MRALVPSAEIGATSVRQYRSEPADDRRKLASRLDHQDFLLTFRRRRQVLQHGLGDIAHGIAEHAYRGIERRLPLKRIVTHQRVSFGSTTKGIPGAAIDYESGPRRLHFHINP